MNYSFLFPVCMSIVLVVLSVRLHFRCEKYQRLYRSSHSERVDFFFFNKLSLGSIFISMLIVSGETSFLWNLPISYYPPVEEPMWDFIETVYLFFLTWLNFHAPTIVESKVKYSEVQRKNRILEGLVSAIAGYVWHKDADGRYVFCDRSFCKDFFGLDSSSCEVVGFNDLELIDAYRVHTGRHDFGDLCVSTDKIVEETRERGRFIEFGIIGDHVFILDVVKTPLFDADGKFTGTIGFAWKNRALDVNVLNARLQLLQSSGQAKRLSVGVYQISDVDSDHCSVLFNITGDCHE